MSQNITKPSEKLSKNLVTPTIEFVSQSMCTNNCGIQYGCMETIGNSSTSFRLLCLMDLHRYAARMTRTCNFLSSSSSRAQHLILINPILLGCFLLLQWREM